MTRGAAGSRDQGTYMRKRRGRAGHHVALVAAVALAGLGGQLAISGSASAAARSKTTIATKSKAPMAKAKAVGKRKDTVDWKSNPTDAVKPRTVLAIKFIPAANEVTLTLRTQPCPVSRPDCVWMLLVNEPYTPARTVVGRATGTSGTLVVSYPADFCGILQADAIIGPVPWRIVVGRKRAISTSTCQPAAASQLPFTNTAATVGTQGARHDPAQLPFTGLDVRPFMIIGMALTMLGFLMASDFEQWGRVRRRTAALLRATPVIVYRWLVRY